MEDMKQLFHIEHHNKCLTNRNNKRTQLTTAAEGKCWFLVCNFVS